mgnify:CR=1 FL=1
MHAPYTEVWDDLESAFWEQDPQLEPGYTCEDITREEMRTYLRRVCGARILTGGRVAFEV